jgi:hypothetical protein
MLTHDGCKRWSDVVVGTLLWVGSIPLDTPQEVFETFGAPLGKYLFAGAIGSAACIIKYSPHILNLRSFRDPRRMRTESNGKFLGA